MRERVKIGPDLQKALRALPTYFDTTDHNLGFSLSNPNLILIR